MNNYHMCFKLFQPRKCILKLKLQCNGYIFLGGNKRTAVEGII